METKEPFVFILDLDGTIIGDCAYQVILYDIETVLKKNKVKQKTDNILLNSYRPSSKLMRPYFKYFIKTIKQAYPNSLFYVYTASEKAWANKEISLIEKTHKMKFNRPIFTRDDCIIDSFGQYRKSVKKILPKIIKGNKKYDINPNKILTIDNNSVYIDYHENFLLCPSYDYVYFIDVWDKMRSEYLKVMEIHKIITNLIECNKACQYTHNVDDGKLLEQKHKWLYKKHKKLNMANKKYIGDKFWKKLTEALISQNITHIDKTVIRNLQQFID